MQKKRNRTQNCTAKSNPSSDGNLMSDKTITLQFKRGSSEAALDGTITNMLTF